MVKGLFLNRVYCNRAKLSIDKAVKGSFLVLPDAALASFSFFNSAEVRA